jgi:very-short-patch-repair endonuclease
MRTSGRPLQRGEFSVLDAELPHVPHAGVARAVADTALQLREFMPIRAMVTSAVQRKLVTPDELAMELVHCPRNHSAFFRQAMTDVLGGAKSVAEAEAVAVLRGRRDVPRFEVNARIDAGGRVFEADVLWPELKVVLEIDSREFHFSEREWKATMARHNLLSRLGYVVLHYPPSVIRRDPKAWADEVAACLRVRRAELLRPLINTA